MDVIFIFWIVGAIVVGFIGNARKIGFFVAFLLSILLSPLIGLIITLISQTNKEYYGNIVRQRQQAQSLKQIQAQQAQQALSIPDELAKLKQMYEQNMISEVDYEKAKSKLIG
jgi:uncharacterized protein YlxW (UPF0749 family)